MKLVTLKTSRAGEPGVILDDWIVNLPRASEYLKLEDMVPVTVAGILAGGLGDVARIIDQISRRIETEADLLATAGIIVGTEGAELMAPIPRPGIVLSHARAYRSHLDEMRPGSKPAEMPTGFIKNSNSVIGPDEPIVPPAKYPDMLDFEGEFSVVIGKPCHDISADDAMDYVAGYTIINDISARDWVAQMHETGDKEPNRMGKQFPTFCPLGPVVATKDDVPNPHNVTLKTTLNDKVMQDAHTSDLIWSFPEIIAHYAHWYPFEPGDVISSGTPAGVGHAQKPPVYMKPGDIVAVSVDGVGTLRNPVAAPTAG